MHRLHGLPLAVVEEALQVLTRGSPLDRPAEAIGESIEKVTEPIKQRFCAARFHGRQRKKLRSESTVRSFGSRRTNK
jgi:hypothetical protein